VLQEVRTFSLPRSECRESLGAPLYKKSCKNSTMHRTNPGATRGAKSGGAYRRNKSIFKGCSESTGPAPQKINIVRQSELCIIAVSWAARRRRRDITTIF
jgi:hypothetical protein